MKNLNTAHELYKGSEESNEKVVITPEGALERINTITESAKLAKYVRTLAKHGIIVAKKEVPYYEKGALTPADGVEDSQVVIDAILAKKSELTAEPAKTATAPKAMKSTDIRNEEKRLRAELINKALEAIPFSDNFKQLEERAYKLHQAGLIVKINTKDGYSVQAVEGVKDSQELVDLIKLTKKQLQVAKMITDVKNAKNRDSVWKIVDTAVHRGFLHKKNEDYTMNEDIPNANDLLTAIGKQMEFLKKTTTLTHNMREALKKF